MDLEFTITQDDLLAGLTAHIDDIMDAAEGAVTEIGNEVITDAKETYVPVDSGNLRASGYVDDPVRTPDTIELVMGFGGAAASYALAIHEHPSAISPPSWLAKEGRGEQIQWSKPGTGPKYLQTPFFERAGRIPGDLAAGIRGRLG
jgi:hypothetical protein